MKRNIDEFAPRLERLKGRLYRIALLRLGGEAAAVEAVDEAAYRALRGLHRLREPEFFETWATGILLNVCREELRRLARETPAERLPDTPAPDALDALPLRDAVERLPEELRAVVELRYFADFTLADTARALGLPQGTAASRQRRALALLKLELEEEEA